MMRVIDHRKRIGSVSVVGLICLTEMMRNPRFAGSGTVAALQLVALGICFGIAVMAVWDRLKPKPKSLHHE